MNDSLSEESSDVPGQDHSNANSNGTPIVAERDVKGPEKSDKGGSGKGSRGKSTRPIPTCTYRDALDFAKDIFAYNSGNPVLRESLLAHLNKGFNSSATRELIAGTAKYGLITGNFGSKELTLNEDAQTILSEGTPAVTVASLNVSHGILSIDIFKTLYEEYKSRSLPAQQAIKDFLSARGIAKEWIEETVDTFVDNAKFTGILKVVSGTEKLITPEHLADDVRRSTSGASSSAPESKDIRALHSFRTSPNESKDFSKICFYVTPIGDEGTEFRQHSDLFLNHIVAPAVAEFDLNVVRADQISESGTITKQIIEHIARARLVIVDLSFHNPNVFYELAIRHACRLPTVQIIRKVDRIPFDVATIRTIEIDDSSIYTLIPQMQTYKSEIASQVRRALSDNAEVDNPIVSWLPGLQISLPT